MAAKPTYSELVQKVIALEKETLLREQAEEELKKDRETLRSILNASTESIVLVDTEGTIIAANDIAGQRMGRGKDQLVGMGTHECLPHDIAEARMAKYDEVVRSGQPLRFQDERQGRIYENSYYPVFDTDGNVSGLAVYASDITESKRDKERLRESEERLYQAMRISKIGVFDHDHRTNTVYWSPQQREIYGWGPDEPISMKEFANLVHPEDAERIRAAVQRGLDPTGDGLWEEVFRIVLRDGSIRWVKARSQTFFDSIDETAHLVRTTGATQDISEEIQAKAEHEKIQAQLIQAQKMDAIGTLAGGIAHDFNNILSAIIGYTELAELDVHDADRTRYNLKEALKASLRAKDLVNQILVFSRKTQETKRPIQVKHILKESLKLLRATLPTTIQIHNQVENNIGIIEADPSKIHQVIMNLCTNAGHAMREQGGILGIQLSNVELGETVAARYPDLKPGKYIALTISDTGPGISAAIKERIFDPYFTTKQQGEGTGLGLTIAHGIIKNYDGHIELYSEPGKGATFRVYLPIAEHEMAAATDVEEIIPRGNDCILFVDDEPTLVDIGSQMLESLGYKVETRSNSLEALELFRSTPEEFDLVITDMTMPHMTGRNLAKELMAIRSDIPIIICTGFSERMDANTAKEMGIQAYVKKPIAIREIANTVREVLDRKNHKEV